MATLLLRLSGQRQAYDTTAEFSKRRTEPAPTKSAIIGMVACALGKPQIENGISLSYSDLANLKMGVRIDKSGKMEEQYSTGGRGDDYLYNRHTGDMVKVRDFGIVCAGSERPITPLINGDPSNPQKLFNNPWTGYIERQKCYLVDAAFTVALQGAQENLKIIHDAFLSPKWLVFLGRKACFKHFPIILQNALTDQSMLEALQTAESIAEIRNKWFSELIGPVFNRYILPKREPMRKLRCILECLPSDKDSKMVRDVPLRGLGVRPYEFRFVRNEWIELPQKIEQVSKGA